MKASIISAVLVIVLLSVVSSPANAHGWGRYHHYGRGCAPVVRYCPPVRVYAPVVRYCPPPRYCYSGPRYRPQRHWHRGYYAY